MKILVMLIAISIAGLIALAQLVMLFALSEILGKDFSWRVALLVVGPIDLISLLAIWRDRRTKIDKTPEINA